MTSTGVTTLIPKNRAHCATGRWTLGGVFRGRVKVAVCPNRVVVGSVYCEPCRLAAWARVGVKA